MRFPNKVNRYKTTIIYQMTEILNSLGFESAPADLYRKVSKKMDSKAFYEALSALYAIGRIEMSEKGRIRKC